MLRGGLDAWQRAGLPTVAVARDSLPERPAAGEPSADGLGVGAGRAQLFLPGLVENYAQRGDLPIRREFCVLFVDVADSTATVAGKPPEQALAFVQRFMGIVTEAALAYCGDVKDYEGDGALLYFESVTEASRAALAIRDALARQDPVDGTRLRARLSLDVGDIVVGVIGTPLRRSVALIGASINRAARLLKEIPPDGVIATAAVVERLGAEAPDLAGRFSPLREPLELRGFERELVRAFAARPGQEAARG